MPVNVSLCGSVVEHRRSEVRFPERTQNFFFVPRSWQDGKHLSLFLIQAKNLPSLFYLHHIHVWISHPVLLLSTISFVTANADILQNKDTHATNIPVKQMIFVLPWITTLLLCKSAFIFVYDKFNSQYIFTMKYYVSQAFKNEYVILWCQYFVHSTLHVNELLKLKLFCIRATIETLSFATNVWLMSK